MIETTATVIALDGGKARVVSMRQSPCGSCTKQAQCSSNALTALSSKKRLEFEIDLKASVHVGQTIRVGIPENQLLRSTLTLYGIPLVGLLTGTLIASAVLPDSDGFAILGACFGFITGFLSARHLVKQGAVHTIDAPCHVTS